MNSLKVILVSFVLFLFSFNPKILAQGEAAVPFLLLEQSPMLLGMGWTGTSLPNDEPAGFYFNPAQLGHSSQHNNLSFQFYPSKTKWIFDQLSLESYAFNLGYNFKEQLDGLNLSVGFGYIYNKFDYGEYNYPSGSFYSYDEFNAYAIGIGLDYYIQMSAGITIKDVYSKLGDPTIINMPGARDVNITAIDYGVLFTVPVVDLAFDDPSFNFLDRLHSTPFFDFSLGFSVSNIGDEVWYVDAAQKDPIPRTSKLSYTASMGIDFEIEESKFNFFKYDFTVDVEDILIDRDANEISYQPVLSDIQFYKNFIELEGTNNIIIHKGHRISLFETFVLYSGSMSGKGYQYLPKFSGYGLSTMGIFKYLSMYSTNEVISFIANHFNISYYNSNLFKDSFDVDMDGITLNFKNFYF